ncbi:uncharacterized protein CLUP02_13997 [Colletotrichum lupini]|uniref:Uncharacterized protein n=1 Tax=Colletotrichum lupini TaxID=145971 RepID=A0A9Q8T3Z8_9PEZI|nr:uncharacterized protein CLUP02_13997 [Colletotrichum lupini]UQC88473.1 hypothetical protein CLUP02_13997 [Colletotrichum lupini]
MLRWLNWKLKVREERAEGFVDMELRVIAVAMSTSKRGPLSERYSPFPGKLHKMSGARPWKPLTPGGPISTSRQLLFFCSLVKTTSLTTRTRPILVYTAALTPDCVVDKQRYNSCVYQRHLPRDLYHIHQKRCMSATPNSQA